MKRSFVTISIITMLMISILPAISTSGDKTGEITYNPGGGGNVDPIKILAIWETNGESYLDDDTTSPGCQVDPPMEWNQDSTVCVYVAVLDEDDDILDTDQIKIDIYYPDNGISDRPDLGDGTKVVDNLEPVVVATWAEYMAAHSLDYGSNSPFICYYNQANDGLDKEKYDYVNWTYFESNVKLFRACYDLYYHDPAGWYKADVTIQGSYVDSQHNFFEYVYSLGAHTDFDVVDWGLEHQLNVWHAVDGNWDWDFGSDVPPTIKNVGNWDAELGFHFTNGDFNANDVRFDVRAGDSNPESDYYCPTYCEVNGIDGMVPCNWNYYPLPVNNYPWLSSDYYDDVLLKCHKMKLDFYICVLQWTNGPGPYSFGIDIFCEDPSWQPAAGFPCPNGQTAS